MQYSSTRWAGDDLVVAHTLDQLRGQFDAADAATIPLDMGYCDPPRFVAKPVVQREVRGFHLGAGLGGFPVQIL
jgi:hypothetical protein